MSPKREVSGEMGRLRRAACDLGTAAYRALTVGGVEEGAARVLDESVTITPDGVAVVWPRWNGNRGPAAQLPRLSRGFRPCPGRYRYREEMRL
jgi:hypothetical protein